MADNFDPCVAITLGYEGGFSDNPADPGGATNFGITLRTLEAWAGHAMSVDDVRNMDRDTAIAIYRANYWNLLRCGDLAPGVDLMVFDFAVNSGPATSAKALQKLAGVAQDGSIGPLTIAAAAKLNVAALIDRIAFLRMSLLRSLATFAVFGSGWTRRVSGVQLSAHGMAGDAPAPVAAPVESTSEPTADDPNAESLAGTLNAG